MAKLNFWLGKATGKLAGAMLQRGFDGRTVIRDTVTPRNPRTDAQQTQRIIMNTVVQAYARTKVITNHSFEGVKPGMYCMSAFKSRNANMLRQTMEAQTEQGYDLDTVYAFTPLQTSQLAPNGYILSEGSLPGIKVDIDDVAGDTTAEVRGLAQCTYRDIINTFQLCRGDQLTFVAIHGATPGNTQFRYARVILDPVQADGAQASLDVPFVNNGTVNLPNPRNAGSFTALVYARDAISFALSRYTMTCAGIIVSRQSSGQYLCSSCRMAIAPTRIAGAFHSMQHCLNLLKTAPVKPQASLKLS